VWFISTTCGAPKWCELLNPEPESLQTKAARIKLLLFDVDGVLTDGAVIIHGDGSESKRFGIRDGIAMVWAQRSGLKVGLLSARTSATTPQRAAQLGITLIHQGVTSKVAAYERILADERLSDQEVAFMGDDIVDLAVLGRVGLSAAPADAVAEVVSRVDWVSSAPGGNGAARELVETVLRAQNLWDAVMTRYLREGAST
jgi:3-deoxy-D-manno-octulosonate 8-phosphate phosphatase (KDO 8-P phosphatase)